MRLQSALMRYQGLCPPVLLPPPVSILLCHYLTLIRVFSFRRCFKTFKFRASFLLNKELIKCLNVNGLTFVYVPGAYYQNVMQYSAYRAISIKCDV